MPTFPIHLLEAPIRCLRLSVYAANTLLIRGIVEWGAALNLLADKIEP